MRRVVVQLLGRFAVSIDGHEISLPYAKLEALLAYLVTAGRVPVPRERLAGLLWPDLSQRDAAGSLRQALARLRRLLGDDAADAPLLMVDRRTVRVDPKRGIRVDVWQFEDALGRILGHRHRHPRACPDCAALRRTACDLYRGDFLADLSVPDSDLFEAWCIASREQLLGKAIDAFAETASWLERSGDLASARAAVGRLLEIDPWNESAHSCLLRLLVRAGQRSEAVRHYQEASRRFREDLGILPSQELAATAERLLTGPSPEDEPGPATPDLPTPMEPLVGRSRELSRLSAWINDPERRLITITGPGGVGKTRLAISIVQAEAPSFDDGARFVRLEHDDPEWHLDADRQARGKDLLLALDGVERPTEQGPRLLQLLEHHPSLVVLATSRVPLRIAGESVLRLQGLAAPPANRGEEIERYDAAALFLRRAQLASPDFALGPEDREAVAEICRLVDGMPLAIGLAAAWVTTLPCTRIAAEIRRGLDILAVPGAPSDAHSSIRAVFEQSLGLLTQAELQALRRLSVFRAGFDREAAHRVAGADLAILAGLVGKSFVHRYSGERFHIHDMVRHYGEELLSGAGETEQTMNRQVQYYLEVAEARQPDAAASGSFAAFHWLVTEQPNLMAALTWAVQHQLPAADRLARCIRQEIHGDGTHRWTAAGRPASSASSGALDTSIRG